MSELASTGSMRIAVIGAGVSGLVAAHRLFPDHDVHVYEANRTAGGHVNTVTVERDGRSWPIDTGFIVYNEQNYPHFTRLLAELDVDTQPTSMSFSVRCDTTGIEYNGTSLNTLFGQRRNLLRRSFHQMVRDILRFNREAVDALRHLDETTTVETFVREGRYRPGFVEQYLVPLGSALWSCPAERFRSFPIRFVIQFLHHHRMLTVGSRPVWRVIRGGSRRYVEALTRPFADRLHLGRPVRAVTRLPHAVELTLTDGERSTFDHVIIACHADQALRLLSDASPLETRLLSAFPYQENLAILHTDASVLPRTRRAWASWNYRRFGDDRGGGASVTYNMNMLQSLEAPEVFCVTLDDEQRIDPERILQRITYHHPLYTTGWADAQRRHHELIDVNRTSFCGAYWGYGFHEDGVRSGLAVAERLLEAVAV